MADILSQQAAEKSVVREAVAKRSLQEIQQEQEFLSWWDGEAKRVADEEAAVAARGPGDGRARAAGPGARRGRNRGARSARGARAGEAAGR